MTVGPSSPNDSNAPKVVWSPKKNKTITLQKATYPKPFWKKTMCMSKSDSPRFPEQIRSSTTVLYVIAKGEGTSYASKLVHYLVIQYVNMEYKLTEATPAVL